MSSHPYHHQRGADLSDLIEPHAAFILVSISKGSAPEGTKCEDAYAVSIAISLKRIADALESQANIAAVHAAYAPATHDLRGELD